MKSVAGTFLSYAAKVFVSGGRVFLLGISRFRVLSVPLFRKAWIRIARKTTGIKSLRLRLCLFFSLFLVAAWLVAAFFAWKECREYINEFFDSQQMLFAKRLAAADFESTVEKLPKTGKLLRGAGKKSFGDLEDEAIGFAVFTVQGELIINDGQKGRRFPFSRNKRGFSDERLTGKKNDIWRIVRLVSEDGRRLIAVGQEIEYRRDMAFDMLGKQIAPWLFLLPVLLLGLFLLLSRELAPLHALAGELRSRAPENTSPLDVRGVPAEVLPMAESLNGFFSRTNAMLARERSFISDAAHELRTPLAGLGVQAQIAAREGADPETRTQALGLLRQGIDRCARLVEQLLALSRLETMDEAGATFQALPSGPVAWTSLFEELVGEYRPRAAARGIGFESLVGSLDVTVRGYPALLSMMLRNLLENAVRYTPEGGCVHVTLENGRLIVRNTCTDIPEAYAARLGERFFRPPGQEASGSGLGLSIVKRIAAIHRFTMDITTAGASAEAPGVFQVVIAWNNTRGHTG